GRDTKEDAVDPAVGVVLEVKVGARVEEGNVLCRIHYTSTDRLDEAVERIEDAFRISTSEPEPRDLILEVVG
ncbi:MAG: thymidine phosphorylase, partial [Bryobacteraceae bacterium]